MPLQAKHLSSRKYLIIVNYDESTQNKKKIQNASLTSYNKLGNFGIFSLKRVSFYKEQYGHDKILITRTSLSVEPSSHTLTTPCSSVVRRTFEPIRTAAGGHRLTRNFFFPRIPMSLTEQSSLSNSCAFNSLDGLSYGDSNDSAKLQQRVIKICYYVIRFLKNASRLELRR